MALRHWSTTPSGNANTAGINWAEGQPPSTVNDSARQEMAQVRQQYRPDQWHWVELSNTASVASQTSFRVSTDLTSVFHAQRRVRLSGGSTTRYASVVSSSFTAETTVTITVDAGSLSSSHSIAALGPSVANPASPQNFLPLAGGTLTGDLTISKANAALALNATSGDSILYYQSGGSTRFVSGFSVGGNYWYLNRYDNAGGYVGTPVTVDRPTGNVGITNQLTVAGHTALNSTLNVTGITNMQGTYTAHYGDVSVCGNGGAFVPSAQMHVADFGVTTALIQARDSNQARLQLSNPNRTWLAPYIDAGGSFVEIYDFTGGAAKLRVNVGSPQLQVFGDVSASVHIRAGGEVSAGNDLSFRMMRSGVLSYFQATADDWMQFNDSASSWDLVLAGAGRLGVTPNSMIWGPASHTFLTDGILRFRAFADGGLPSVTTYSGGIVFSASVPGRMWMTNDGATWKRQDFG